MKLYENDALVCEKEFDLDVPNPPNCAAPCSILLGEYYDTPSFFFHGNVDNLYIYDFTVNDVTDLPCNSSFLSLSRLLVGLRWWNHVNEDGTNTWKFESAPKVNLSFYPL